MARCYHDNRMVVLLGILLVGLRLYLKYINRNNEFCFRKVLNYYVNGEAIFFYGLALINDISVTKCMR